MIECTFFTYIFIHIVEGKEDAGIAVKCLRMLLSGDDVQVWIKPPGAGPFLGFALGLFSTVAASVPLKERYRLLMEF